MYECYPQSNERSWQLHWWSTLVVGVTCSGWLLYSEYGCDTEYCAECSWLYISEYLFFWSMFLLVWWRIDPKEVLHYKINFVAVATEEPDDTDKKEVVRNKRIET